MKYTGLQQQISSNNRKSVLLLLGFPLLLLAATYFIIYFLNLNIDGKNDFELTNGLFLKYLPFVLAGVAVWFVIAYFSHSSMISYASNAHALSRKENMRVYNLVENLCIGIGMTMPKIQIIESDALNAFASGLNEKTYTVTLTRGIIDTLDDDELEGVIAHELMHIRNKDVRLLVISLIFVGIFSLIVQLLFRGIMYGALGGNRRRNDKDGGGGAAIIVILVISVIAYFLSLLFKLALSRKREYMADSGAAQMTKNPMALASALRKISGNANIREVKSDDVKEMFIENPPGDAAGFLGGLGGLFSTHPPIEKRIAILEQF